MRLIKIGMANINTTVGAPESNSKRILDFMRQMEKKECTIGCFQEQVIPGYPCEDLIQWNHFIREQWAQLERIRLASAESAGAVKPVFILGLTVEHSGNLYNAAAVVCAGYILGIVPKEKLPTYGIFYDGRTFSRGVPGKVTHLGEVPFGDLIFRFPFGTMAVEVCEDVWSPDGPMRRRAYSGAELVVNISASPYRIGIQETRKEMISTRAADNQVTFVYVNQYGGNDSLVFDGGAYVNQNGQMLKECERWREGLDTVTVDLNRTTRMRHENTTWRTDYEAFHSTGSRVQCVDFSSGPAANQPGYHYLLPANKSFFIPAGKTPADTTVSHFDDLTEALVTGLDYYLKTGAFRKIGIALSGGKDSLLTLVLAYLFACRRFGTETEPQRRQIKEFIVCFSMPARYNTETTRSISRKICTELGVTFKEISIQDAFEKELSVVEEMLAPGEEISPLTRQNIQARIRGERMQNWCNSSGGMWIQTGNMSEKAVGYTTIGGDMMGAYSLIANLPKTLVIALLDYLHKKYHWEGIRMVLETKASAELADDQEDERDLMPFAVLDACMYLFAEEKKSPAVVYTILKNMWSKEELIAMCPVYRKGLLKEWVIRFGRLFTASLFKWVQTPQAVHVGKLELDRERALQLPVVQSGEWLELDKMP